MRKLSKLVAVIMCFVLVSSVLSVVSSAASSVTYSVSSASGKTGDTVTVYVNVSGGTDIWGCSIKLSYDPSQLQFVSSSNGAKLATGSVFNSGSSVNFSGSLNSCKSSGGTIFSVKFKILASSGTCKLTMSASGGADNVDSNGNNVPHSVSGGSITVTKPVTGITLDKSSVTLKKGETATITPTVTPADATNKSVTYSTSNSKVAKVSGGKITAVGGGTATITATAGGKSAKCTVYVKVAQTGIAVSGSKNKTVSEGSTLKLSTAKVPSDATDSYGTTWKTSDPAIATVSTNGTVTGVKPGTVTITATQNGWTATYTVTITEKPSESESVSESESETESEESSNELTTENTTAPTTTEESTTQKTPEKTNLFKSAYKRLYDRIFDKTKTVSRTYYYIMTFSVGFITATVCIPVTALVTSSIYKNKDKKKDPDGPEEK